MERVRDFPRPPAVVPSRRRVRIELGGAFVADSTRALRVLETFHPPTIYVPPQDVALGALVESDVRGTLCEFKGLATYLDVEQGGRVEHAAAWTYRDPVPAYAALHDHLCFYPSRMDSCWLDEERVRAQEGDFYGGWITHDLVGPFKGAPGTLAW